jgi:hypothetical protein
VVIVTPNDEIESATTLAGIVCSTTSARVRPRPADYIEIPHDPSSLIAFISHLAAMQMAASVAIEIAQRQRLADQAQRLSYNGAFDLVAWTAGAIALVLAFVAARGEMPRMRTLIFAAALVANLWNLCVV